TRPAHRRRPVRSRALLLGHGDGHGHGVHPSNLACRGGLGCAWRPSPKRGHESRNTDSWEARMSVQRAPVLVVLDGAPDGDRPRGWAADEAARFGMSLRIVHVAETATLDVAGRGAGEVSEALAEAGDRILQDG